MKWDTHARAGGMVSFLFPPTRMPTGQTKAGFNQNNHKNKDEMCALVKNSYNPEFLAPIQQLLCEHLKPSEYAYTLWSSKGLDMEQKWKLLSIFYRAWTWKWQGDLQKSQKLSHPSAFQYISLQPTQVTLKSLTYSFFPGQGMYKKLPILWCII